MAKVRPATSAPITRVNPYNLPKVWGRIWIGGAKQQGMFLPGVVSDVDGVSKPETWVVQQGIQVSHAITIWRGTKIAEDITITLQLPDKDSFDAYYDVRSLLRPKLGSRPPAFTIANPIFAFAGVTRVSVRDVLPPKPAPGLSWTGVVKLIEFNPPKLANVGPPDPPKQKSENDLLADELGALIAKAKK